MDCDWDDLGGFLAADRMGLDLSAAGAAVAELDATGNLVFQRPEGLVALLGVSDLIVVRAGECVQVCPRDRAEELKRLVQHLKEKPAGAHVLPPAAPRRPGADSLFTRSLGPNTLGMLMTPGWSHV